MVESSNVSSPALEYLAPQISNCLVFAAALLDVRKGFAFPLPRIWAFLSNTRHSLAILNWKFRESISPVRHRLAQPYRTSNGKAASARITLLRAWRHLLNQWRQQCQNQGRQQSNA